MGKHEKEWKAFAKGGILFGLILMAWGFTLGLQENPSYVWVVFAGIISASTGIWAYRKYDSRKL